MASLRPEVQPEEVGLSAARLERIRPLLQQYVESGKLPGLVSVIARYGKLVQVESVGWLDIESKTPMTTDAIFRLYSMTKPVTSVAALMLYEEGLFQLDDPVSMYIPAFRRAEVFAGEREGLIQTVAPKRPITVRDLFLHTGGLNMDPPQGSPLAPLFQAANLGEDNETLEQTVNRWLELPLSHHPGEHWSYGSSTDALAHLVEVLSGQAFDVFLQERIFAPLGMKDTGFYAPPEKHHRLATVYGPPRQGELRVIENSHNSPFAQPRKYLSGSAGLVSTAADYYRFAQMLLNGGAWEGTRLLGRKTVELMTRNHLPEDLIPFYLPWRNLSHYTKGCGFGLGVRVVQDVPAAGILGSEGEYGWSGKNNTYYWADPQEGLVLLLFTQFQPFLHYPVDRQFKLLTYQAIEA